jgi:hypothetical protein
VKATPVWTRLTVAVVVFMMWAAIAVIVRWLWF